MDTEDLMMLNRFGEQFPLNGIDISLEELCEFRVFDKFLAFHVQPDRTRDVQFKRVWNEWVRTFRDRIHGFPKLILEKELSSVITDKFRVAIAGNGFRGVVYCGIRFAP
jgi:hypothetical protein